MALNTLFLPIGLLCGFQPEILHSAEVANLRTRKFIQL